jgi:hypothetical protein
MPMITALGDGMARRRPSGLDAYAGRGAYMITPTPTRKMSAP